MRRREFEFIAVHLMNEKAFDIILLPYVKQNPSTKQASHVKQNPSTKQASHVKQPAGRHKGPHVKQASHVKQPTGRHKGPHVKQSKQGENVSHVGEKVLMIMFHF